ncbi:vegetative cell wall protein gp1 [Triticum aestivum]|uniref:vegetative cell wall protein gp1 n=1 Tax=Triticum aestivum TaxID=4565 RepID=UPI001D01454F|nr:vegetative cell wall protein gp1-like [Triticum aestivum]
MAFEIFLPAMEARLHLQGLRAATPDPSISRFRPTPPPPHRAPAPRSRRRPAPPPARPSPPPQHAPPPFQDAAPPPPPTLEALSPSPNPSRRTEQPCRLHLQRRRPPLVHDVKPSPPCSPKSAAVADRLLRPRPHIPALVCRHHRPAPPSPTSHPRPARRLPPKNPAAVSILCLPDHLFPFCEVVSSLRGSGVRRPSRAFNELRPDVRGLPNVTELRRAVVAPTSMVLGWKTWWKTLMMLGIQMMR